MPEERGTCLTRQLPASEIGSLDTFDSNAMSCWPRLRSLFWDSARSYGKNFFRNIWRHWGQALQSLACLERSKTFSTLFTNIPADGWLITWGGAVHSCCLLVLGVPDTLSTFSAPPGPFCLLGWRSLWPGRAWHLRPPLRLSELHCRVSIVQWDSQYSL